MTILEKILTALNNPDKMEHIYRNDPVKFSKAYKKALADNPESILLQAWEARLEYRTDSNVLRASDIFMMIVLCLAAGTLLKIPEWTSVMDHEFYPRYAAIIPFSAMFLFTMQLRNWPRKTTLTTLAAITFTAITMSIIPAHWEDSFALAGISIPFLLWSLYGSVRLGINWKDETVRIEFLKFSAEVVIHAGLFFIGGGVLLLLTAGLFDLLNLKLRWILEYPAVYGLAAIPLVAVWATDTYSAARRLVPLLAQIFSPLLLLLTVSYMVAMAMNTNELFQDRSSLLTFNVLLLCVLTTTIFTLTGQGKIISSKLQTAVISLMIFSSLVLDTIALSAICWRIIEYGITANRTAVLGSNMAILGNLFLMARGYVRYWMKTGTLEQIEKQLAAYLPVYVLWSIFSVFIQPWIFRY